MIEILKFLNENLGFVTFIAGSIAIFLYITQKRDYKRDATNIILMEIRHAEQMIKRYRSSGISIGVNIELLLPTDSWNKYNYLFIKDLDRDEIDAVNNFYNQCAFIDKALLQLNLALQLEQKAQSIHQALSLIAKESLSEVDFKNKKDLFIKCIDPDNYLFRPKAPMEAIVHSLNIVNFITTTTAASKLKMIAKIKR